MEVLREMVATLRGLCNQVSEKLIQATSALVVANLEKNPTIGGHETQRGFFFEKKTHHLDETIVSTAVGGGVSLMDLFFFQV